MVIVHRHSHLVVDLWLALEVQILLNTPLHAHGVLETGVDILED